MSEVWIKCYETQLYQSENYSLFIKTNEECKSAEIAHVLHKNGGDTKIIPVNLKTADVTMFY